jgi:hypothetical protein
VRVTDIGRYRLYVDFCERVGVTPAAFETWLFLADSRTSNVHSFRGKAA